MGAEIVTCKFRVSLIIGEASRKVLRATLLPEVRMRTAITVAIVLVWAAPAVAQSTAIDTGHATSVQIRCRQRRLHKKRKR